MKKIITSIACIGMLGLAANASASSITMDGDYVLTAVGGNGTLGAGGSTYPGIRHDPTGTADYGADDYLTPGSPWEMFSVRSDQTGLRVNNNTGGDGGQISSTSITDVSASSAYDNQVDYVGYLAGFFDITHETYFNDGDERISITTTISALTDLTSLSFARALDPDPDVYTFGSYSTVNGRGFDSNGDGDFIDSGDIAPEDWVHAGGTSTGLTIGLYSDSDVAHNTAVTSWSSDPTAYLAGGVSCVSCDHTIGIAFDIGTLLAGESISFDYAYVMGASLDSVDIPNVPEPSTLFLLGAGLAGLLFRKKQISHS